MTLDESIKLMLSLNEMDFCGTFILLVLMKVEGGMTLGTAMYEANKEYKGMK